MNFHIDWVASLINIGEALVVTVTTSLIALFFTKNISAKLPLPIK